MPLVDPEEMFALPLPVPWGRVAVGAEVGGASAMAPSGPGCEFWKPFTAETC